MPEPTTQEYKAAGDAYHAAARDHQPIARNHLAVLAHAFDAAQWRMHHPLVSINPVEALSALLVDIDNSRYALDKHSGPGAAIWRAASGLTPFGMRALAQLIEAAPELLAEGRKYLG